VIGREILLLVGILSEKDVGSLDGSSLRCQLKEGDEGHTEMSLAFSDCLAP
jgi:hypothetical protein